MKISIITVTYNSGKTLAATLASVASQTYPDIEHIVIDGDSKDDTLSIVNKYPHVAKCVSETDKGMYDALNKGLALVTGDIIGVLNSDDIFHNKYILEEIVKPFSEDKNLDAVFGDIRFVQKENPSKTRRYYSSARFNPSLFEWGYMPAHPSFYCKRNLYENFGNFHIDYQIAADYELLTRFFYKNKINYKYLPLLMVDMLPGGLSNGTLSRRIILNKEIIRACAENGISTNMFKLSLKYIRKVFEYIAK